MSEPVPSTPRSTSPSSPSHNNDSKNNEPEPTGNWIEQGIMNLNTKVENFYYQVGLRIAKYPWTILIAVTLCFVVFAAGLATAKVEVDFYQLWIDPNSRLIPETDFYNLYFADQAARTESIIAIPKDGGEAMTPANLQEWNAIARAVRTVTVISNKVEYKYDDLCQRPDNPPLLEPFLNLAYRSFGTIHSKPRLPCIRTTVLDCFYESGEDFITANFPETLFPGLNLTQAGLPLLFKSKPSIYDPTMTTERALDLLDPGTCTIWANLEIPDQFVVGGMQRDSYGNVTASTSLFSAWFLQSAAQLAKQQHDYSCALGPCIDTQCTDPLLLCLGACTPPFGTASDCAQKGTELNTCMNNQGSCDDNCYYIHNCTAACTTGPLNATECNLCNDAVTSCQTQCHTDGSNCATLGCVNIAVTCIANCRSRCAPISQKEKDDALAALLAWETAFVKLVGSKTNAAFKNAKLLNFDYLAQRTSDDFLSESTQADGPLIVLGYSLMFIFTVFVTSKWNRLWSKALVGFMGVVLVLVAFASSFGLIALFGIPFSEAVIQVLPFMAVGLGINDVFVMVYTFRYDPSLTVPQMAGEMLREMGTSTALSSLTNVIAFAIGSSVPLPAVSGFSLAALVSIIINYIVLLFGFTAVLVLDAQRIKAKQSDCFPTCCVPVDVKEETLEPRSESKWVIRYAKLLEMPLIKVLVILGFGAILGIGIWGAYNVELGLPLSQVVPKDSYARPYIQLVERDYHDSPSHLVFGMDGKSVIRAIDYTDHTTLRNIAETENLLQAVPAVLKYPPMWKSSWIDIFLKWTNSTAKFSAMKLKGIATTSYPMDFTSTITLNTDNGPTEYYLPQPSSFYPLLKLFLVTDGLAYTPQIAWTGYYQDASSTIVASTVAYYLHEVATGQQQIDAIITTRAVTDAAPVPCYPQGGTYSSYEQYLRVREYMVDDLIYVAIASFFTILLLLFSPIASIIMLSIICMTVVETYGYLYFWNIKMNGVCVVNLIMSVGVSVEFNAYIIRAFMIAKGTRNERATTALVAMFIPTVNGAFATFLAIVMMAGAHFPYFTIYFFQMYLLIIILGCGNGVILLPVILSLIGPRALSRGPRNRDDSSRQLQPESSKHVLQIDQSKTDQLQIEQSKN